MTLVGSFQLRTFYGSMITSSGADEKLMKDSSLLPNSFKWSYLITIINTFTALFVPNAGIQFYFPNACLQMGIITAVELATGLSRSVINNSLDQTASMQSVLCPQK